MNNYYVKEFFAEKVARQFVVGISYENKLSGRFSRYTYNKLEWLYLIWKLAVSSSIFISSDVFFSVFKLDPNTVQSWVSAKQFWLSINTRNVFTYFNCLLILSCQKSHFGAIHSLTPLAAFRTWISRWNFLLFSRCERLRFFSFSCILMFRLISTPFHFRRRLRASFKINESKSVIYYYVSPHLMPWRIIAQHIRIRRVPSPAREVA